MGTNDIKYSKDGMWQVEIVAFKINLLAYKAIGTTIYVRHKEMTRGFLGLGRLRESWVDRPVTHIYLANVYSTRVSGGLREVARNSYQTDNSSNCDGRQWAVGVSITVPATADTGLPSTPSWSDVGSNARLPIDAVSGSGYVYIGDEAIATGVVEIS